MIKIHFGRYGRILSRAGRAAWLLMPIWLWLPSRHLAAALMATAASRAEGSIFHDILDRAGVTAEVIGPAFILYVVLALHVLRLAERRVLQVASAGLIASAAWSGILEYQRLAQYRGGHSWLQLLPYVDIYIVAGSIAAILLAALPFGALRNKRIRSVWETASIRRAESTLHGDAQWMKMKAAQDLYNSGGVIIGEAYRVDTDRVAATRFDPDVPGTWGRGGTAPVLRFDGKAGNGHALALTGSGGFKTVGYGIPTCLEWPSSLVYLDPSCEVGPIVKAAREAKGRRVVLLDPANDIGFNALSWLDPLSPSVITDIQAVAAWLCGERPTSKAAGGSDYFEQAARGLVEVIIAEVVLGTLPPKDKTLSAVRGILAQPMAALQKHLAALVAVPIHPVVSQLAGTYVGMAEEQWSGVYGTANESTRWLSAPRLAKLVSGDDVELADLAGGTLDVFIQIPVKILATTPAVARVVVGALLNSIFEADGKMEGRVLFLLDEVYQLGYMQALERARDLGRKYGISLFLLYQSAGQLVDQWGHQGKRAWYDSTTFRAYACVQDLDTAREISETCGGYTAIQEAESEGEGTQAKAGGFVASSRSGSTGRSLTPVRRPLILPDEVMRMRDDEQIVFSRGQPPLRCGRALYFRRKEMASLIAANRFSTRLRRATASAPPA